MKHPGCQVDGGTNGGEVKTVLAADVAVMYLADVQGRPESDFLVLLARICQNRSRIVQCGERAHGCGGLGGDVIGCREDGQETVAN